MAQTQRYNHITVTPSSDDDIVIHAGAKKSHPDPKTADIHDESSSDMLAKEESASIDASTSKSVSESSSEHSGSKAISNGYKPTSIEDIESSKMPRAQIVVIVLAVLAVAAFVIWYIFFA